MVVDVFDAITAIDEIEKGAGTQFDPTVVSVFVPVARRLELAAPHRSQNAETR